MEKNSSYLKPLPIQTAAPGSYSLTTSNLSITTTFEAVANAANPLYPIPPRVPEIRNALANTLRNANDPSRSHLGPWTPKHPRYKPHRSTIIPLLSHHIWQTATIRAAAYTLFLPAKPIAGTADVILQYPNQSIGVATLVTTRPARRFLPAITAELGGYIAALIDHRLLAPDHGVIIWAAPDQTKIQTIAPDRCLSAWVDALDLYGFATTLKAEPSPSHSEPTTLA